MPKMPRQVAVPGVLVPTRVGPGRAVKEPPKPPQLMWVGNYLSTSRITWTNDFGDTIAIRAAVPPCPGDAVCVNVDREFAVIDGGILRVYNRQGRRIANSPNETAQITNVVWCQNAWWYVTTERVVRWSHLDPTVYAAAAAPTKARVLLHDDDSVLVVTPNNTYRYA